MLEKSKSSAINIFRYEERLYGQMVIGSPLGVSRFETDGPAQTAASNLCYARSRLGRVCHLQCPRLYRYASPVSLAGLSTLSFDDDQHADLDDRRTHYLYRRQSTPTEK